MVKVLQYLTIPIHVIRHFQMIYVIWCLYHKNCKIWVGFPHCAYRIFRAKYIHVFNEFHDNTTMYCRTHYTVNQGRGVIFTDAMRSLTVIGWYSGFVFRLYDLLLKEKNDYLFDIVRTGHALTSTVVSPLTCGSITRYINYSEVYMCCNYWFDMDSAFVLIFTRPNCVF